MSTYTIGRAPGLVVEIADRGAAVRRVEVTDPAGRRRNAVLSWPDPDATGAGYLGAIVGRYANRIAAGRFILDGTTYELATNDRGQTLHGGPQGFDTRVWQVVETWADSVELGLTSPDGDQGFPGELTARVRYSVAGDTLTTVLTAVTDAPTVVNLTTHCYWNLAGTAPVAEPVLDHLLWVPADRFLPIDDVGIPLGEPAPVDGLPFDLRSGRRIADVVHAEHPQVAVVSGLDHDLLVPGEGLREVARLEGGGLALTMESDQPGVQVFTGQGLPQPFPAYAGVALEPQRHPDSPNRPEWPSPVLRPGELYRSTTRVTIGAPDGVSLD
ncbi:MAG TPA: aldose epimerase family protein [Nocardioides sp.]|uniref:aldose epimerase family protein n=1 Tax=Nocardioides sp. TaxID=35761 RepID=UPI002ED7D0D5